MPRHLVLFNRRALVTLLEEVGFTRVVDMPAETQLAWITRSSLEIAAGARPTGELELTHEQEAALSADLRWEGGDPERREFLTIGGFR